MYSRFVSYSRTETEILNMHIFMLCAAAKIHGSILNTCVCVHTRDDYLTSFSEIVTFLAPSLWPHPSREISSGFSPDTKKQVERYLGETVSELYMDLSGSRFMILSFIFFFSRTTGRACSKVPRNFQIPFGRTKKRDVGR